ncbi:hypothetical protein GALL_501120 [mine drainage metagenome]|uniref:Uncharacterized protein n=1 Tax=mine drainage metagenome TaxID=410659 RepID=A0A1J5P9M7_9ZZZZ
MITGLHGWRQLRRAEGAELFPAGTAKQGQRRRVAVNETRFVKQHHRITIGIEQGVKLDFRAAQNVFLGLEFFKQAVKAGNQLADFILVGNGQGVQRLVVLFLLLQYLHCHHHRRELAAQHQPGQGTGQQGQKSRGQQHALLHGVNRGKGFGRGNRRMHQPVGYGYVHG